MEYIQSKQNPKVKQWKKLGTLKGRQQQGRYLIEGTHLVIEALKSSQAVQTVLYTSQYDLSRLASVSSQLSAVQHYEISEPIAKELSNTQQPQGVFAEVMLPETSQTWQAISGCYLLVDAVQDPGNLGTLIRTADAAGFDGVILGEGTVDVYNDKVIRATQGSLWHLPVIACPLSDAIKQLQSAQVPVYATALHQQAIPYYQCPKSDAVALIVGNEGEGVAKANIAQADQAIFIPMPGEAESLNVAIAAGILMFHFIAL